MCDLVFSSKNVLNCMSIFILRNLIDNIVYRIEEKRSFFCHLFKDTSSHVV